MNNSFMLPIWNVYATPACAYIKKRRYIRYNVDNQALKV
jgi:hypothetical protein